MPKPLTVWITTNWKILAAAAAKLLQSCPTLCDLIDGSPPGSLVPGILQARTLERVAISFSNAWKWKVKGKLLSRVQLLATPWTVAHQAPLSMWFSRQEYWSGLPFPIWGYFPDPGIETWRLLHRKRTTISLDRDLEIEMTNSRFKAFSKSSKIGQKK